MNLSTRLRTVRRITSLMAFLPCFAAPPGPPTACQQHTVRDGAHSLNQGGDRDWPGQSTCSAKPMPMPINSSLTMLLAIWTGLGLAAW